MSVINYTRTLPEGKKSGLRELQQSVKNLGIVVKVARKHWVRWPWHIRNLYELEDLVQEIVTVLVERSPRYDQDKAQPSTWVWVVADNYCKTLINSYMSQKRHHNPVQLKEARRCSSPAREILWSEACQGFEALLRDASEDLLEALDGFIADRGGNPRRDFGPGLIQELQALTARHRINQESMALLFSRI